VNFTLIGKLPNDTQIKTALSLIKSTANAAKLQETKSTSGLGPLGNDLVDQAIFPALFGGHVVVTFGIKRNACQRLTGALSQDDVELLTRLQNLACLNLNVGGLTLTAA
jgi:hypothetical protein